MISALLLSRVLWPRLRLHLRFLLARFSFADKCTFFLASFPQPPLLPPSFNPSSTHTTFACFIAQEKSKLCAASFALKKKREKTFLHLRVAFQGGCRRGGEGEGLTVLSLRVSSKFEECCISFHIFLPIFGRFFLPLAFQIIQP